MNREEAFELWKKMTDFGQFPSEIEINIIQNEYENKICELHKKLLKKKKQSSPNQAYKNLMKYGFEEKLQPISKSYQEKADTIIKNHKLQYEQMKKQLIDFAQQYSLKEENNKICIFTEHSGNYNSQGYGASKYARKALASKELLLNLLGFDTNVKEVNKHYSGYMNSIYYADYELWANISQFDYQMLQWSEEFISVLNWAVLCWKKGVNPMVYFPTLSQDDYKKSQVLSLECNYEITKENMKLELSWDEINKLLKKIKGDELNERHKRFGI